MKNPRYCLRCPLRLILLPFALLPLLAAPACTNSVTGSGTDMAARVPAQHRAAATACAMTRPPGPVVLTTGTCKMDSDCVDGTMGQNGRCVPSRFGATCTYDRCFDDSTCGGRVCLCRPDGETTASLRVNGCLSEGNCRTDADCGAGGACSPSFSTCGAYTGVVAYYCHTPQDTCVDDTDCTGSDGGGGGPGYCMFSPQGGLWLCAYTQCVG